MSKTKSDINARYWDDRYLTGKTGWDVGYPVPAILDYFNQVKDKTLKILIPGAGTAHEGIYLYKQGFTQIYLLEYAPEAMRKIKEKCPDFPQNQLIQSDFFKHKGSYDLIVEHTFFSSLPPERRSDYVLKTHELLKTGGKLVGLFFDRSFEGEYPPYGARYEDYKKLFSTHYNIKTMEAARNSIKPRQNTELFVIFEKI